MNIFATSLEASGRYSGIFHHTFSPFYTLTTLQSCDVVFVVLENKPDWTLDIAMVAAIKASGKPVVVLDYWELDWQTPATDFPEPIKQANLDWKAYFKRELSRSDTGNLGPVYPIDWYNHHPIPPVQTEEEWNQRDIDVLMIYGYSHPMRPLFHGELLAQSPQMGWTFITDISDMEYEKPPYAVLLHCPWYRRLPMNTVLDLQKRAKVTISLPGAGVKCFRSTESCIGSIMAKPKDNLLWQAGWNEYNHIELDTVRNLKKALESDLYPIYLESQKVADAMRPERVWNEHILPKLK